MSVHNDPGFLGIYAELDAAVMAIEKLREMGMKDITVFSPTPRHELEHALDKPESPVRMFTLVGALTGAAAGFALAIWTSLDWPLITGGKAIISLPAFVVPAFEVTILLGALSTAAGLLINARLPNRRKHVVYDPSFSVDRFGVYVEPPHGREEEVRAVRQQSGAAEIREWPTEVSRGNA